MANVIQLITKYATKAWDKVYKAESLSSILDGESDLIKFTGTKTVKIAKVNTTGLYNYNRANNPVASELYKGNSTASGAAGAISGYGYQQGSASLVWEEFTIRRDRGAQYRVELFDDEETDGLAVGAVTKEVSRTQVIPEVDAYCFSEIANLAGKKDNTAIADNDVLKGINSAFYYLEEQEVPSEDQVIFMSAKYFNKIRSTSELYRRLNQVEYKGNVSFTISEYEGRKIYVVPQRRFKTLIDLKDDGIGGYTFKDGTEDIDFIVCAKSAVSHIVKYDKVRIFSPNVVQDFDGYKVNVRIYHDVFVPDNKRVAIYCHTSNATATDPILISLLDASKHLVSFRLQPGETFFDHIYVMDSTLVAGTKVGDAIPATVLDGTHGKEVSLGADLSAYVGGKLFASGNGKVVAIDTVVVPA